MQQKLTQHCKKNYTPIKINLKKEQHVNVYLIIDGILKYSKLLDFYDSLYKSKLFDAVNTQKAFIFKYTSKKQQMNFKVRIIVNCQIKPWYYGYKRKCYLEIKYLGIKYHDSRILKNISAKEKNKPNIAKC